MPASIAQALSEATETLENAGIENAMLDARVLFQHAAKISLEQIVARSNELVHNDVLECYEALIARRKRRQPVAQITGQREFWGMQFKVTRATLTPRPDSETLIEAVLKLKKRSLPLRILDLGTGSGCLLLSLLAEYKNAQGVGVDVSAMALAVARENAEALGVADRVEFLISDWDQELKETFDVVISNPPYIPAAEVEALMPEVAIYEPKVALTGGDDGLKAYREILPLLTRRLDPGGIAVLEIGAGQEEDVKSLAAACGVHVTASKKDLAGTVRCIVIEQP